ncbi:hypothetical protein ACFQJC_07695 [Haloferax namakaokahaiae]|uniref:Formyl transferase n=1 Tax=Haloferax namakaokahaiae TaxID=1748331 RepID=A0ABD5ZDM6_9EURY
MTGPALEPLRVTLLLDEEYVEQWQYNALASLVEEPAIEITHVVINSEVRVLSPERTRAMFVRDAISQLRRYPLWSLVGIARTLRPAPTHTRPVHISSLDGVSSATRIDCHPTRVDTYWNVLPDGVVDEIGTTDVAIRFGFGMLKGDVLSAPTYGVLSYHLGDVRTYRGQVGGFYEFINDEDEMGITLQRLTETLDGGEIVELETIDISGLETWQEIRQQACYTAERMLLPGVRTVTDPNAEVTAPDELGTLYKIPKGRDVVSYLVKNSRGRFRRFVASREPTPTY